MRSSGSSSDRKKRAGTRVALAPGTAAQLVVHAARFVALGADDVQSAAGQHLLVQFLPFALGCRRCAAPWLHRPGLVALDPLDLFLDIAAQHDVGAAARHVGGDGDHLRAPGLRDDLGLARVLLGVQHLVRQLARVPASPDSNSEFSIEVVPTSTGCPRS